MSKKVTITGESKGEGHDDATNIANKVLEGIPKEYRVVVMITRTDENGVDVAGSGLHGYTKGELMLPMDIEQHVTALQQAGW